MENLCAICGQPKRLVPAGVSKTTGKDYNSFFACNDRTHKQPKNIAYQPQNTATGSFSPKNGIPADSREWTEKYNNGKTESMLELNAKNGAAQITAAMISSGFLPATEWEKTFKDVANKIYNHKSVPFD